ncbi:MAG TPA: phage Gp37/Gp68 family protein [Rhizobiaceae bacterium]|nr:phage Gp37/Gp68 family protein [Rhizobiaceae bacterium]
MNEPPQSLNIFDASAKIALADATWNPVTGCSVVSPGCTNCYAMKLAGTRLKHHSSRAGLTVDSKAGPVWNGKVRLNEQWLDQPLRWTLPRMIFVCAHGDLFHESVPDEWIDRVFAVMALTPQHTYQVLSKRSARMRAYVSGFTCDGARRLNIAAAAGRMMEDGDNAHDYVANAPWPLPNVWLGVSAEDQARADERIPDLLATPAAIRFVSAEPLLGPIDFETAWVGENALYSECWGDCAWCEKGHPPLHNCHRGRQSSADFMRGRSGLEWIITGGESGPGARPMHPDWARQIRDQCAAAGVPFFFKQWGSWSAVSQMSEDDIDRCYPPLRERHPEETRHCLVDHHVLHADGSRHGITDRDTFLQGTGAMTMFEVGKKRAGRLLDGIEHNGMPQREVPAL